MKNYIVTILIIVVGSCNVLSQTKIWNNWYFGEKAGLSFDTEPPTVLTNGQLSTLEGCASISDDNGNLLFYTNGVTVWDRSHSVMANGTGLMGHESSSQSAIILPKPKNKYIYYIFTANGGKKTDCTLRYSVVDIRLNGGLGGIISGKKNVLIHNDASEGLTATIHSNGVDYWIISHSPNSSKFYCNILSSSGVEAASVISEITPPYNMDHYLKIKVSSFSDKIAITNRMKNIRLFSFNNTTGKIKLEKSYNFTNYTQTGWSSLGVEFSENNTKLYASLIYRYHPFITELYQFDLSENSFVPVRIDSINGYVTDDLQIASDGKIYVACVYKMIHNNFLSVINNPNEKGTNCDFQFNSISLTPGKCKFGLPNCVFISHKLTFDADNVCFGDNNTFTINNTQGIQSQLWNFGDGTTSTEQNPTHTYAVAGTYTVNLTATYTNGTTQTVNKTITINQTPLKPIIEHD